MGILISSCAAAGTIVYDLPVGRPDNIQAIPGGFRVQGNTWIDDPNTGERTYGAYLATVFGGNVTTVFHPEWGPGGLNGTYAGWYNSLNYSGMRENLSTGFMEEFADLIPYAVGAGGEICGRIIAPVCVDRFGYVQTLSPFSGTVFEAGPIKGGFVIDADGKVAPLLVGPKGPLNVPGNRGIVRKIAGEYFTTNDFTEGKARLFNMDGVILADDARTWGLLRNGLLVGTKGGKGGVWAPGRGFVSAEVYFNIALPQTFAVMAAEYDQLNDQLGFLLYTSGNGLLVVTDNIYPELRQPLQTATPEPSTFACLVLASCLLLCLSRRSI